MTAPDVAADARHAVWGGLWGAAAGLAFGLVAGVVLLVDALTGGEGVLAGVGALVLIGGLVGLVASGVGFVAGCLTEAVAVALRDLLAPTVGGPLVAAAVWTIPWVASGHLDVRDGTALAFFLVPLALGCTAAWRWGRGVVVHTPAHLR